MADRISDEQYRYRYIPDNFETGINAGGFNFQVRNFIEGIIIGMILAFVTFCAVVFIPFVETSGKIGLCLAFGFAGVFFGVQGINDEPVSVFLKNRSLQRRNRKTSYYNPRVKDGEKDPKPYVLSASLSENAPKEKIRKAIRTAGSRFRSRSSEKIVEYQSTNYFQAESMFFEADERAGIRKPKEYMSEKELKKEEIREKKAKKEMKKAIKRFERQKEERGNG